MRVLVACEESQAVCKEFRKLGHEAYSCDILPESGGHPEWHLQGDASDVLRQGWDMIIAFPPCTYTSNAGARHLYPKHVLNEERLKKGILGRDLFMLFYNANCDKVCVENPLPSSVYCFPAPSQVIQPYMFGHPVKKRTQLWLRGLTKLEPTDTVDVRQSTKVAGNWFNAGGKERQKARSKTFPGIARAMAEQWG